MTTTRKLWKHQEDFLRKFKDAPNAAMFFEMGTGKTMTAAHWMRHKMNADKAILPTLILSPLATLHNWKRTITEEAPRLAEHIAIAHGKNKDEALEYPIVIANYEILDSTLCHATLKKIKPAIIICDESHKIKSGQSKRFKTLLTFSDYAKYRLIMTGTPILNSYLDLWAQFRFLDGGRTLYDNFFVFRAKYFRDHNAGMPSGRHFPDWRPLPGTAAELSEKIKEKSSRVTKEECLSLPPLVQVTEHIPLGKEQKKAYTEMEESLITEVKSGVCAASNALTRVLRMLQILAGHLPVEPGTPEPENYGALSTHRFKENPRLERLSELLEELTVNHKIIVWCTFQADYHLIQGRCAALNLCTASLTGLVSDKQREIDRFKNNPECKVLIGNPSAGGVGVDGLQVASYAVYYSRSYSLGDRLQSEARNHRGGSEMHSKITHIDLVAKDTLDDIVLQALLKKENFAESVLTRLKGLEK